MARNKGWLAAGGAGLALLAVAGWAWQAERHDKPALGLFSSLPIYWNEPGSVTEVLDGGGERHWVRVSLENDYRLVPLDTLDGAELSRLRKLVMAQPRPLAPQENVALDEWVRNGGQLLLFADPLLTERSRFTLGDKRRPQDVVLLSPILGRWGLELTFDESQEESERTVADGTIALPERLGGRLRVKGGADAKCALAAEHLVADCRIGQGHVVVVADAALLETDRDPSQAAPPLGKLLDRAFHP
jgi:hypothetical protein